MQELQVKILNMLKEAGPDGFVSGEEIASRLNVSRTAVWKPSLAPSIKAS